MPLAKTKIYLFICIILCFSDPVWSSSEISEAAVTQLCERV